MSPLSPAYLRASESASQPWPIGPPARPSAHSLRATGGGRRATGDAHRTLSLPAAQPAGTSPGPCWATLSLTERARRHAQLAVLRPVGPGGPEKQRKVLCAAAKAPDETVLGDGLGGHAARCLCQAVRLATRKRPPGRGMQRACPCARSHDLTLGVVIAQASIAASHQPCACLGPACAHHHGLRSRNGAHIRSPPPSVPVALSSHSHSHSYACLFSSQVVMVEPRIATILE